MEQGITRRCGALGSPDGSVHWRVWAPTAKRVDLVLIDEGRRWPVAMTLEDGGYFRHSETDVPDGRLYAYSLDGGPERPDPASLSQPDGVHGPSAVVRTDQFSWTDQSWKGPRREELVFYELHVGAFTPEGTFDAVIPRLPALKELGITALEIMPVAQFPGTRNWGYDGVNLYAAQNSYGGPHGLQRLVNACHAVGLAAFLDVVYNHVGPEGNYLHAFGPYFADRYRTFWGEPLNYDGAGSDPVRDFVIDNARMWIEEYHLDGLRLDAVHAIYDMGPRNILRAIKEAVDATAARAGRRAYVVAESDLNDVRLLLPPERGGYGLDAQWSDDFHHAVHAYLTGERQGYYEDFGDARDLPRLLEQTFLYGGNFSKHRNRKHGLPAGDLPGDRFIVAIQNHDQVGNRARGDRLSALMPLPAQRLAASLMLLSPHLPLLFMGEEYGEQQPFLFFCSFGDPQLVHNVREGRAREFAAFAWQGEVPDPHAEATFAAARLTWAWPEGSPQAGLRRLYQDLLAARRRWPALRDFRHRSARLLPDAETGPVLQLTRGKSVQAFFNLTQQPQPLPREEDPRDVLLFSSEARRYHGERTSGEAVRHLLPYECVVFGPGA